MILDRRPAILDSSGPYGVKYLQMRIVAVGKQTLETTDCSIIAVCSLLICLLRIYYNVAPLRLADAYSLFLIGKAHATLVRTDCE